MIQLFGIDSDERQIYFRSGITSDEQTGKMWYPVDLPHKSCTFTQQQSDSMTSSVCSLLSMDQLSAELQNSARADTQNCHMEKSSSLQDFHRNQLCGIETSAGGESKKVDEKFQFKSRFAVSYKPSSNIVKMNTGNEKSKINTEELEQSVLCPSDVYPNHVISGTNDSLSEGLDSISINSPSDIIKEDGTDILWTSVSASACSISDEIQIRNWLICKGETEVVSVAWQKILLHSRIY